MHKRKDSETGFTLIELLVVIAIIGLLSAVVIASLNSARNKGKDTSIKSTLKNIQTQMQFYANNNDGRYNTNGTSGRASVRCDTTVAAFANTFVVDPKISEMIEAARSANGGTLSAVTLCALPNSGSSYAIAVQLKTSTNWFCIDSLGASREIDGASAPNLGGGTTVPAVCPPQAP